jgi:pilus assembly protein CpaB
VRRRTIAILLAVVLALVAAGLVVWYVSSLKEEKAPVVITKPVIVAAANIPARTTGAEMVANGLVKEEQVPEAAVIPGAVTDLSALDGMVISVPVVSGQQLLQTQLAKPETQAMSFRIKQGMRAVTLPIDRENAVGGSIQEGDRVDVIATIRAEDFQSATLNLGAAISPVEAARLSALTGVDLTTAFSPMSFTVLQQAEVLAVDTMSISTTPTTQESHGVLSGGATTAATTAMEEDPVITLMVTPADAQRLVFAKEIGKLWFVLIPTQDTTKVTTEGVVLPNLLR